MNIPPDTFHAYSRRVAVGLAAACAISMIEEIAEVAPSPHLERAVRELELFIEENQIAVTEWIRDAERE